MTVPDFQSLMLPLLQLSERGQLTMREAREQLARKLRISDDDLSERLPSGRQTTFANRVAWAKIYLERAALIESVARGVFVITDRGHEVLQEPIERIDMNFLRSFPEYLEWRHGRRSDRTETEIVTDDADKSEITTPEEAIENAHLVLLETLQDELLERLIASNWQQFEQTVVDLMTAMGYGGGKAEMAKAFKKGADDGLDGSIKEDLLGLDTVYVQAKCWARNHSVGRPDVQAFVGSLEGARATKGVFVTTANFSQPAKDFVERVSKKIVLIDGKELTRLLVKHNVAVRTLISYEIKSIDEDYFV